MKFLVVAGGTGGHVLPGIALAEYLCKYFQQSTQITFLTIERNRSLSDLQHAPFTVLYYDSPLRPAGLFALPRFCIRLLRAILHSILLMRKEKITAVLGFGSYASFPAICAAILSRTPLYLFEQNVVPGMVIRMMSRFARQVFVNFPIATRYRSPLAMESSPFFSRQCIPHKRIHVVGNPIRSRILQQLRNRRAESLQNQAKAQRRILILGGSQGARQILHIVGNLLQECSHEGRPEGSQWEMPIHWVLQCGDYYSATRNFYVSQFQDKIQNIEARDLHRAGKGTTFQIGKGANALHTVSLFDYRENIHEHYAHTDLLICRAGAGVLSEALLFGLPMIIIPLPNSADLHQQANAAWLEKNKAARVLHILDENPKLLALAMEELLDLKVSERSAPSAEVANLRAAAIRISKANAAQKICEQLHRDLCQSDDAHTKPSR